jgi:hypothetical protein
MADVKAGVRTQMRQAEAASDFPTFPSLSAFPFSLFLRLLLLLRKRNNRKEKGKTYYLKP